MKKQAILFALALIIPQYSSITIFEPLTWEDTWNELYIQDFENVNHKQLSDLNQS